MKHFISVLSLLILFSVSSLIAQNSFYDFVVKDIDGNDFALSQLKGQKVMLVNVASKCHYTPQYEALEALYQKYKNRNFIIIAFPANNFMKQEPGTDAEIKAFCTQNYGVTFPVMSKISVKGKTIHPLYQWLTQKSRNGVLDSKVKWNFQKYLIDENGHLVKKFSPGTKPNDPKIIEWIESE